MASTSRVSDSNIENINFDYESDNSLCDLDFSIVEEIDDGPNDTVR